MSESELGGGGVWGEGCAVSGSELGGGARGVLCLGVS